MQYFIRANIIYEVRYGVCLNKNIIVKKCMAMKPPYNAPRALLEHAYPRTLAMFGSGAGSPLCWVSLLCVIAASGS